MTTHTHTHNTHTHNTQHNTQHKHTQHTTHKHSDQYRNERIFGARVAEDGRRECGWVPLSSPMQVELNDNTSVVDRVEENLENKVENKVEVTSMPKFSKRGQSYDNDEKMFGMDGGVGACTSLTTMVLHKPLSGFRNVTWSTACESAGVGSTVTSYDECFVGSKYFNSFREYPTFVGGKLDASKKEPLSVSTGKGFVHVNDIDSEQQYQSYGRCSNSDKWIPPLLNTDGSGVHNSIKKCFGDTSPSQFWPNDRKQEGCTNMVSDDPTSNPDNKARLCTPDMCKPYTGTPFLPLQCSTQPHVLDSFKTEEVEEKAEEAMAVVAREAVMAVEVRAEATVVVVMAAETAEAAKVEVMVVAVRGAARAAAARVGRTGHTRRISATCTWWPRSCLVGFRVGVKVRVGLGLG